jgi:hypothetical protein
MSPTNRGTFDYDRAGGFVQGRTGDKNRAQSRIIGEAVTPIFVWGSHARLISGEEWLLQAGLHYEQNTSVTAVNVDPGIAYEGVDPFWSLDLEQLGIAVANSDSRNWAAVGLARPVYAVVLIQATFTHWAVFPSGGLPGRVVLATVSSFRDISPPGVTFPLSLSSIPIAFVQIATPMDEAVISDIPDARKVIDGIAEADSFLRHDAFMGGFATALNALGNRRPQLRWLQGADPGDPRLGPRFLIISTHSSDIIGDQGILSHPVGMFHGENVSSLQGFNAVVLEKRRRFNALLQERLALTSTRIGGDLGTEAGVVFTQGRWVRAIATEINRQALLIPP